MDEAMTEWDVEIEEDDQGKTTAQRIRPSGAQDWTDIPLNIPLLTDGILSPQFTAVMNRSLEDMGFGGIVHIHD